MYPPPEPFAHGMMDTGDGNRVYWEVCGNPQGKAALVLHGGPGSGCTVWHRRLFDPRRYRMVLFDQRGCGRSLPHAADPTTHLATNTTPHLLRDIEQLRQVLGIERWLVLGGSWGSTLALAYADQYPQRVSELVLFGVTTGRRQEFDWAFRGGLAHFFPAEWQQLEEAVPLPLRGGDIVEAYARLLHDHEPEVRRRAADAWCLWESASPEWPPRPGLAPRFSDPRFAMAFARIVTHYVRHNAWIADAGLPSDPATLADIPGVLINGRFDFQAPLANAWHLHQLWPRAELVLVGDAGHAATHSGITDAIVRATDGFAPAG